MAASRSSKSASQKEDPSRTVKSIAMIEQVGESVRMLLVVGVIGFLAWCGKEAVVALAGKVTDANIAVNFLANLQVSVAFGWAVGGGGVLYGYSQNKLRKRDVRRLHTRLERFERMHDPNRTTSQLGPTGETNVEDA